MKRLIFYLATVAMCLSSCSTDEQTGKPDPGKKVPLGIGSVSTESVLTPDGAVVRATSSPLTDEGAAIGIFGGNDINVKYVYHKATASVGAGWSPDKAERFINLGDEDLGLFAYYPYNQDYDSADDGLVPMTAQKYSALADLCFSDAVTASSRKPIVSFELKHAYARITFSITRTSSYPGICAIERGRISDGPKNETMGIASLGEFTLFGGYACTFRPGPVDFEMNLSSLPANKPATYSLLMVPKHEEPYALGEETIFSFWVDGKQLDAPLTSAKFPKLKPGVNYKIEIEINGMNINVKDVKVVDWVDVPIVDPIIPVPV